MKWFCFPIVFLALGASAAKGGSVQIDISDIFNARPISTMANGVLVPQNATVDGSGGFATQSAAAAQDFGDKDSHALPDNAKFPAGDNHPAVLLAYVNDDGRKPIARVSQNEDIFVITVPEGNYTRLFLIACSGRGASDLTVDLKYSDKTIETRTMQVPDWYDTLKPDDKYRCAIATDLSKWNSQKMLDKDHRSIFGIDVQPNPAKTLVKIRVHKSGQTFLTVFGATGETKDAATPAPK